MRHTVGLVDPLTAADRPASERVNDGLPETLEEVVSYYRGRYYKLKVGGDIKADLERLGRIAAVLDAGAGDYRATLDGNEQYDDVEGIVELWRKVEETPALARLVKSTLFIEQPIKRAVALSRPVEPLARLRPVIIDESDGELRRFPAALKLGYAGVSSKNCKGFYKSILNAARVAKLGAGPLHVGRGSHDLARRQRAAGPGAGVAAGHDPCRAQRPPFHRRHELRPGGEQKAFVAAHPDLYENRTASRRV